MNDYKKFLYVCFLYLLAGGSGCSYTSDSGNNENGQPLTDLQQELSNEGWYFPSAKYNAEFPDKYGVKSRFGQEDNYFDIEMGDGCDVAIKIINKATDQCIRYVYVPENSTVTIQMIPQGEYYLKLAYGRDWMEYENEDGTVLGKFTDKVSYEKSVDTFDFGVKNSNEIISNILRINVKDRQLFHNFTTVGISESEFMN